jgi:undecaprenyl-diphosphatase
MNWWLVVGILVASAILLLLERRGVPLTLSLSFRGDIKRETAFLAQYGQSVATPIAAVLVWQLDPKKHWAALAVVAAVCATSLASMIIKRMTGRVRPNRERAGQFLGPSFWHANYRESFPSSHSACAFALSVVLARFYPAAAATFWSLAVITAALRYVLDAHWLSDVVFGCLLGYVVGQYTLVTFQHYHWL